MALDFIKKVFSFGRKQVEERPADAVETPSAAPVPVPPPLASPPAPPPPAFDRQAHEPEPPVPPPLDEGLQPEALAADPPEAGPAGMEPVPAEGTGEDISRPVPFGRESLEPAPPAPAIPPAIDRAPPPPEQAGLQPEALQADPPEAGPAAVEPPSHPAPAPPEPAGRYTIGRTVERVAAPQPAVPAPEVAAGWFQRLRSGLSRSSRELGDSISGLFTKGRLTEEVLEDLEDALIRADLGMETAIRITGALESGRYSKQASEADIRAVMAVEIEKTLAPVARALELDLSVKPHVILVVGVNGTGKTTTIGKLAAKLTAGGLRVMLAAGDTFRAAAIEQLKIWGERTKSPVVATKLGADAAGLAYEAFQKAREAGSDVLIIDTAGRLQNKAELMAELEKIVRVLRKHDPEAPHTVLQTVDATTGQNALNQVEIFRNVAGVNGLVMTKLDGTARGGILVAIAAKHGLPVYFVGVGEQVDDLEPFSARDFARAIAGVE